MFYVEYSIAKTLYHGKLSVVNENWFRNNQTLNKNHGRLETEQVALMYASLLFTLCVFM